MGVLCVSPITAKAHARIGRIAPTNMTCRCLWDTVVCAGAGLGRPKAPPDPLSCSHGSPGTERSPRHAATSESGLRRQRLLITAAPEGPPNRPEDARLPRRGQTPVAKGRTPVAKGQTPVAKGRTPMAKGQTLVVKGRTPMVKGRKARLSTSSWVQMSSRL